ncbi:MAG: hypothetical protein GY913_24180 [Proteobacteria bacterium]|nr:hypothetical protein [Pseudomonadota bacterium]MCP4920013.1 hypothetical protein [Pseudomonadota bacterium]
MLLTTLACVGAPTDTATTDSEPPPPMEHLFSFVVIADPHISTGVDNQNRLAAAVEWVNQESVTEPIELVWVVGDIGWGEGLPISKELLDELIVPYAPIIGDNEVYFGDGARFDEIYSPQYKVLEETFDGWTRGQTEVYDDVNDRDMVLQNFAFSFRELRWVGLDWCSRDDSSLYSEFAELHDVDGGTFPYFSDELLSFEATLDESVLMFSHHPMHLGSFDLVEMESITGVTSQQQVAANWAGHIHQTAEIDVPEGGYTSYVTDATWDDDNTVRVVRVLGNGVGFEYEQSLVVID